MMEAEKDLVAKMLRAVLQSNKDGVVIERLQHEYNSLTGERIPFKKLGYPTLEGYLKSVPSVVRLENARGQVTCFAVVCKETEQIAKFVARQRSSKKRTGGQVNCQMRLKYTSPFMLFGKPKATLRQPGFANPYDMCIQRTAPALTRSKGFQWLNKPVLPPKSTILPPATGPFREVVAQKQECMTNKSERRVPFTPQAPRDHHGQLYKNLNDNQNANTISRDKRETLSEHIDTFAVQDNIRQLLKKYSYGIWLSKLPNFYKETYKQNLDEKIIGQLEKWPDVCTFERLSSGSHSDALLYPARSIQNLEKRSLQVDSNPNQEKVSFPSLSSKPEPLNKQSSMNSNDSLSSNLKEKLFELLQKYSSGLWVDALPKVFEETYKERFPEGILQNLDLLSDSCTVDYISLNPKKAIIYAKSKTNPNISKENEDLEPLIEQVHFTEINSDEPLPSIHPLIIPSEANPSVLVLELSNTNEVVIRYIGKDYSSAQDSVEDEMKEYYAQNSAESPTRSIRVGQMVAVNSEDNAWLRAQVISTDEEKIKVFYVDHGFTEMIERNQIRKLGRPFYSLPFQAAKCRLADSPYIAMEATQCYVDAVPSDGVEAKDGNLSSESGDDEEEATQAFVFKSPPIKPVPFKKPHVPSPGASALSLPVCTSSEKEEYSDDENFAVAETQSFCRGPDLSDICVDEEPTQPFFLKGGIGLECPPISMLKDIGSATEQGNARMPGRNSSGEDMGTETLAEEATQLFCAHSTPVTPGAKQCQDPSQDETQPIELYLGLQAGRVESSEADVDHQSVMDQKTKAKLSSRSDNEVKYFAAVKNTRPSFLSTVKTGDSHSSSTSLLESQESLKQSLEAAHSEESTQPLSLRLSEDPTQSYTIDLSKETEETEAFDTEPVLPLLNVQEIRSDGPAIEKDGASPKAFESITTDSGASGQFMQDSGIPTTPAIPPSIDKASEPVPSDRVKSIAPKEVSEAELFVKKKEPALNKRGRKKKPVVEEETVVPPAEPVTVLALPAQEATTYLPDTELEVKEKQPQFRGRQTRRTVANSSSLGKNRKADVAMTEDHEKPNVEEPKEMVDLKEGRKVRQGKGTRRNVTPQEPHCVTVAETDMMEEPSTIQSSTSIDATSIPQSLDQDIEIAAPKEQSTADVDARTTTNLSTPSVAASTTKGPHIVCLDRVASTNTFIKDMKAKISSPVIDDLEKSSIEFPTANVEAISTDAPAAIRPSTSRYDGTKIATTPIAQRRNGKRGQGPDKATLTPVEPERRGYCNQKILATLNAEVEIMEKPKVESAPAHGRGRSKKAPSTNISEQQLEPVVIPVELATLTRTSRTMKLSTVAGSEEELRPAASVSGKLKRVAPVQKEEVDEKKDHLWASGGRKPPKKPLTVEIHKAAEVEPSPAKCREEEVITGSADKQPHKKKADDSSLSTSRHVKETCPSEQLSSGGEQVLSDQSDASACKHVLIANSAAATMVEQAITNEPTLEHASLSKPKESSSAAGKHAPSKQKTVDKPEDMTSLAINTLATGKRDTMEAPEEMTKTPSNKRGNRKRGTGQTKNVEVAMETANSVAVPNDFMKREIVKTSEEVTEEVETPVSAPHVSKKRETTEVKERKAAAKNVIPTPRASRARKNIDTDREGTEEPAMAARASRKRGIVKTDGESVEGAVLARTSKKRGAMDVDKVVVQETNNHDLRAGSEQKKEQTCAADEEIKRKGGLANTAKTAECPGRKLAEKEGADESNAEKTRNAAQEQQQVVDSAIKDLATAETITPPKEVGRRRQQALKTETNFSKVEQGGCSKSKKRRAVSDEDTVATESAATTSNSNSEGSLERAVGGHKKQLAVADELGKATINQLGATEQECGQNSSLSYEGTTDSITIKGVEDSQSNRSQEKIAPYEGRERKEEGKPLETLEAEAQKNTVRVEGPQVRGRGSQRRQPRKVEETSMAEDQQAIVQKATEDIQEEARSWSASRSRSNGRSKTDSSQESVPQGRIRRKQSSASSESKAEDINTAQEAETPRGKGRGPNVSSSPGFFDDHGCPKIMFTGVIDENGEQVVQRLGGELADSVYECTHLVTDRIRRTVKFLCAVARGIPIVTLDWLEKCGKNKCFLSPSTFLVKDREQELNFNFRLSESLQKARKKHLLEGYEIHVTPSVKPEPEHMKDIIQCSGATFLSKMPREYKDKRVIISCSADIAKCKSALSASLPVANSEFILTGILQQLADLDAFRLEGTATARGGDEPRGGKRASTSSSTLPPHTGASKRRR